MLNKATTLKGYRLHSRDGEIGRVKEFYFDDQHWTIRYLVADTGNWLIGRQVLISPYALLAVDREKQHIGIDLTKKQIEDSPSLDSDKPVSRQFEENYHGYYGWPIYWSGPSMWGAGYYPIIMHDAGQGKGYVQGVRRYGLGGSPVNHEAWNAEQTGVGQFGWGASPAVVQNPESSGKPVGDEDTSYSHLRSTHDVSGYHIQAADGEIGHVDDFIIDDETWAIRYLRVDTVNWWPGKKVLVATRWAERVSWDESKVFINLSREAIKKAPEYTEESLLNREYESKLHGHYNRQGYWEEDDK